MSDYTKSATLTSSQSAMKSVIDRVVSELATEGKASWYKMLVESGKDSNKDGRIDNDDKVTTMEIEVTPSIAGADALLISISNRIALLKQKMLSQRKWM